jgi:hypothetical protein
MTFSLPDFWLQDSDDNPVSLQHPELFLLLFEIPFLNDFSTYDTVATDTPARSATSFLVAIHLLLILLKIA